MNSNAQQLESLSRKMFISPSPASSLGSFSSGETDESSNDSTLSVLFDDRKLRLGESYLLEGSYERAVYYFTKHVRKVHKFFPDSDDRVIHAHEKLADAQAIHNDDKSDAIENYRIAINELRIKKENATDYNTNNEENQKGDGYGQVTKRLGRVLVNCGNALLQMSKANSKDREKVTKYCDDAISCYREALPMVQKDRGLSSPVSMELAQRFCFAREIVANRFTSENKLNMAIMQYVEINALFKPYMLEFCDNPDKGNNNYYKANEFLFLKHTINLGLLYLRQEKSDNLLKLFGDALKFIGLKENKVDEQTLQNLNPKIYQMVSNVSHNLGVVYQKRKLLREAIIHFKRVIILKEKIGGDKAFAGYSVIGLGQTYFDLNEYDEALPHLLDASQRLNFDETNTYNEVFEICYSNIATIYEKREDNENCIVYLDKLVQLLQRCLSNDMQVKKVSKVCHRLACMHFKVKNYEEALNAHKLSLAFRRNLQGSGSKSNNKELSSTLSHMGNIYVLTKKYSMAYNCFKELLGFCDDEQKIIVYFEIGDVLSSLNRQSDAIDSYESCLFLASEPQYVMSNIYIYAKCTCKLGPLLVNSGQYDKAINKYEDAIQLLNSNYEEEDDDDDADLQCALLLGLGRCYQDCASYDLAIKQYLKTKEILHSMDQITPNFMSNYKEYFYNIANTYELMNDIKSCFSTLDEFIDRVKNNYLAQQEKDKFSCEMEIAAILHRKACVQYRIKKYQDSLATHQTVLHMKEDVYSKYDKNDDSSHEDMSLTLRHISQVYVKIKLFNDAVTNYKHALALVTDCINDINKALILCELGKVFVLLRSNDEALNSFQSALSLVFDQSTKVYKMEVIPKILRHIASMYAQLDRFDDAVQYYNKAQSLQNNNYADDCKQITDCLSTSDVDVGTHNEALKFFIHSKKKLNIDELCATYNEFLALSENMINCYIKKKDYSSCTQCLKATIHASILLINDKNTLNEEVSTSLYRIGCIQKKAKKYDEGIKIFKLSLSVRHLVYKKANPVVSLAFRSIAEIYVLQEKFQNAINNFREALKGIRDVEKVILLNKMGIILWKMQRHNEAKDCYNSALILCEDRFPEERILLLNNLGNVNICAGHLDEALTCYTQALASVSSTLTDDEANSKSSQSLLNMGMTYFKQSVYQKSFEAFKSFLSVRVSFLVSTDSNSMDSNIATVLNYLGVLLLNQCRYQECVEWFQQSINLLESLPKQNSNNDVQQFSGILSNLGFAHYYLHHYNTALSFLDKAIQLLDEHQTTSSSSKDINIVDKKFLATLMGKSASISFKMKDYESAMEGYQLSLNLKREIGVKKSEELITMHNIALIHCKRRRFNEALAQLDVIRSEKILLNGERHPEIAKILIDIASANIDKKGLIKAKKHLKGASDILAEAKLPSNHPYHIQLMNVSVKLECALDISRYWI